ncbi:MAG TPA: hypothetical protein VIJ28_03555 [Chloroflexota bacterium]
MPRQIGRLLPGHEVATVQRLGAAGMKNGQLLSWLGGKCDLFVTTDRGMARQQHLADRPFAVAQLQAPSNRLVDLAPLIPVLEAMIIGVRPGQVLVVRTPVDERRDS